MKKKLFLSPAFCLIFLFVLLGHISCSPTPTINKKVVNFDSYPQHIIWMQIDGISEEILTLLKFRMPRTDLFLSFEQATCTAKMWTYTLSDIRPSIVDSFNAQFFGTKNTPILCNYSQTRPWRYLSQEGHAISVFEDFDNPASSLSTLVRCLEPQAEERRKNLIWPPIIWKMAPSSSSQEIGFHYLDKELPMIPGTYYDKSCRENVCYSSSLSNVQFTYEKFRAKNKKSFYLFRHIGLSASILKKDFTHSFEILNELEKILSFFQSFTKNNDDTLIVVSGSAPYLFEYPVQGKNWGNLEQIGPINLFKEKSLLSSLWAMGPKSWNFCGFYEESQLLERMFYSISPKE